MPAATPAPHPARPTVGARSRAAALAAAGVLALLAAPAPAQIYRYVDENGETVYSQIPPPQQDAVEITPDPGPSDAESAAAVERLRRQLEIDFDRRHEAKRQAGLKAEDAKNAELRSKNCDAARQNLDTLTNLGARFLSLPDGQTVKPDAAQQARLMEEAREQIKQFCD